MEVVAGYQVPPGHPAVCYPVAGAMRRHRGMGQVGKCELNGRAGVGAAECIGDKTIPQLPGESDIGALMQVYQVPVCQWMQPEGKLLGHN